MLDADILTIDIFVRKHLHLCCTPNAAMTLFNEVLRQLYALAIALTSSIWCGNTGTIKECLAQHSQRIKKDCEYPHLHQTILRGQEVLDLVLPDHDHLESIQNPILAANSRSQYNALDGCGIQETRLCYSELSKNLDSAFEAVQITVHRRGDQQAKS